MSQTTTYPINPDAELIALCAQHIQNMDAVNQHANVLGGLYVEAYNRTLAAIYAAEPETMAGILAKVRAAKAESMGLDGVENPVGCPAEDWAWKIMGDLIRLYGQPG